MGNSSLYVILPKKLMERFNIDIKEGDNVLFEVDNGSLKLTKVKMIKE
jgi:antitoxin component of MazEF toxin-antitoxin module